LPDLRRRTFSLVTRTRRFKLRGDTQADANMWKVAIKDMIRRASLIADDAAVAAAAEAAAASAATNEAIAEEPEAEPEAGAAQEEETESVYERPANAEDVPEDEAAAIYREMSVGRRLSPLGMLALKSQQHKLDAKMAEMNINGHDDSESETPHASDVESDSSEDDIDNVSIIDEDMDGTIPMDRARAVSFAVANARGDRKRASFFAPPVRSRSRVKSLHLKPMQAIRLNRNRRLSGVVSGNSFYGERKTNVTAERLKQINEQWNDMVSDSSTAVQSETASAVAFSRDSSYVSDMPSIPDERSGDSDHGDDDDVKVTDTPATPRRDEVETSSSPVADSHEESEPQQDDHSHLRGHAAAARRKNREDAVDQHGNRRASDAGSTLSTLSVGSARAASSMERHLARMQKSRSQKSLDAERKARAGTGTLPRRRKGRSDRSSGNLSTSSSRGSLPPEFTTSKSTSSVRSSTSSSAVSPSKAKRGAKVTPKGKSQRGGGRGGRTPNSAPKPARKSKSSTLGRKASSRLSKKSGASSTAKPKKKSHRRAESSRVGNTASRGFSYRKPATKLYNPSDISVKMIDEKMGRGVFAARAFKEGEVLLIEKPLLSIQSCTDDAVTCAQCLRFIGPLEDQFNRMAYISDRQPPPDRFAFKPEFVTTGSAAQDSAPENQENELEPHIVECKSGCGTKYCSEYCRVTARIQYHQLLCTGDRVSGKRLKKFFRHAHDCENERFVLAAKVLATIIRTVLTKNTSVEAAAKPFTSLNQEPWWETIQPPDDLNLDEAQFFTQSLIGMTKTSLSLLKNSIAVSRDARFKELFTLDRYASILGAFEMNNWSITTRNPLRQYVRHIQSLPDEKQAKARLRLFGGKADGKEADKRWQRLVKTSMANASGTGLFAVGCLVNHSCMPNVELSKPASAMDDTTVLITRRPIEVGEEIYLSYVDPKQAYMERRDALSFYGFECKCQKCLKDHLMCMIKQPKVEIYTSFVSGNMMIKKHTNNLEWLFKAHGILHSYIDISLDENMEHKRMIQETVGPSERLPAVFVNGKYRGGWDAFEEANEMPGGFNKFLSFGAMRRLSYYDPKFFAIHLQQNDDAAIGSSSFAQYGLAGSGSSDEEEASDTDHDDQ
jgi:SET and MYND domain-containing protein 5